MGLIHTSAGDKWKYLETYLIIMMMCGGDEGRGYGCVRGDANGISWVESKVAARHPRM